LRVNDSREVEVAGGLLCLGAASAATVDVCLLLLDYFLASGRVAC
jgi:hypothetical protein